VSPALGIDRDPDRGILLIKYHDGHRQLDALGFKMLGQDIGVARTTGANGKDTAVFYRSILNEQGDHPVALHFLGVIEFQHGGSMIFWDASAIVPLLVIETQTRQLQSIAAKDSAMPVWCYPGNSNTVSSSSPIAYCRCTAIGGSFRGHGAATPVARNGYAR
jgi:hypothetical protein